MKPTLWNRWRLLIHCLLHFHRAISAKDNVDDEYSEEIFCDDCDFGKGSFTGAGEAGR